MSTLPLLSLLLSPAHATTGVGITCGGTVAAGTTVTLTGDLDCTGWTGSPVITLETSAVLDGDGFAILNDTDVSIIDATGSAGAIVRDLDISTTSGVGEGIFANGSDNLTVTGVLAGGHAYGVHVDGTNTALVLDSVDVQGSTVFGMDISGGDAGLSILDSVFDGSAQGLVVRGLNPATPWILSDTNSFAGVADVAPADPADTYVVVAVMNSSNLVLQNLDVSTTSGLGRGVFVVSSSDVTVQNIDASGRENPIRVGGVTLKSGIQLLNNIVRDATDYALWLRDFSPGPSSLTISGNDLSGSVRGLNLVNYENSGGWTMPDTNSFTDVGLANSDAAIRLKNVDDAVIDLTLSSSQGTGTALLLQDADDITVQDSNFTGFYRGLWADADSDGLVVQTSNFLEMALRGLRLDGTQDAVLSDINLTDSTNGVFLNAFTSPRTFDFATFGFDGVGSGSGADQYVDVRNSVGLTITNVDALDPVANIWPVRVQLSTDITVSNVRTCYAERGVDVGGSVNTVIIDSQFGNGNRGVQIHATNDGGTAVDSENTQVSGEFLGNTQDVVDNGVNTQILAIDPLPDADSDTFADLCDPCPSDPFNDLDGDGDCAPDDLDDDGDGVNDVDDADPNDPNVCGDSDMDTCDDCAVSGASNPLGDGQDTDFDGQCDAGDPDDDNDGKDDVDDVAPLNPFSCSDDDFDDCDDCSQLPLGYDPANDGDDADGDGICDGSDLVIDPAVDFDRSALSGWTPAPEGGIGSPSVVFDDDSGLFVMVFETKMEDDPLCPVGVWAIGLATSPDGKAWTAYNQPLLLPAPGSGTHYECVAAHPTIVDRSSGELTVFFKSEQREDACATSTPSHGICDQYTGIGQLRVQWNPPVGATPGNYTATTPHSTPVLAVGANFGYPRAIFEPDSGKYLVSFTQRPDMLVATGGSTSLVQNGTAWTPGDASWTPDEVYNPAPVCEATGGYSAFVGGRQTDTDFVVEEGYVGRLESSDFITWTLGAGPVLATDAASPNPEMRHFDVLPVGATDYLLYFDYVHSDGYNRVGLASTTTTWSTTSVQSKVCP